MDIKEFAYKKDKTFTCKDCKKEFRKKAYTMETVYRKLCPQCYTKRNSEQDIAFPTEPDRFGEAEVKIKRKPDINNAEHPARQKAIHILEAIAEYMGDENMFDCNKGDMIFYDLEDIVTLIIAGAKNIEIAKR